MLVDESLIASTIKKYQSIETRLSWSLEELFFVNASHPKEK